MIETTKKHTSLFLMANLGSEVSKIFSFRKKQDSDVFKLAYEKAKSIINELKNLPETKDNLEIDIINDIIDDIFNNLQKYDISSEQIDSFFYPFAVRLMSV